MLTIAKAERQLKALANRRRLMIVALLKKKKEVSVAEIAKEIKLSFKSTSKHLTVLLGSEIVEKEQRNLNMFYRLRKSNAEPAQSIIKLL